MKHASCPFCGDSGDNVEAWPMEDIYDLDPYDSMRGYYVAFCAACAAQGEMCNTEQQALDAWDKRM